MKTKIKCLTSVFLTITMLLSIIVIAPIMVNASEDDELTYGDFQYKIEDDNSCTLLPMTVWHHLCPFLRQLTVTR